MFSCIMQVLCVIHVVQWFHFFILSYVCLFHNWYHMIQKGARNPHLRLWQRYSVYTLCCSAFPH